MRRLALLALVLAAACVGPSREARLREQLALGEKLKEGHQLPLAVDAYEQALDLDPTNLEALRGYVESCQQTGRLEESEARFRRQIEQTPGDAYAHEGLGLTLYARAGGSGARAAEELTTATRLAPKVADFRYRLGIVLVDEDAFDRATRVLGEAVKLDPSRPRYRLPYAVALARTGDRPGALAQLKAVLGLHPTPAEMEAASRTAALVVDPFRGFPQAAREQYELALGWLGHDSLTQAQQVLDNLQEKFPDLAIVHATSGLCAAKKDEQGRAIVEFRKAAELAPDLAEPHLYLGDLYGSHGRPKQAVEEYEAALDRNPFLADAYLRLAEAYLKAGDKGEAADHYGTYLLLHPEDFEAALAHATLVAEVGRSDAGSTWDELAKRFPARAEVQVGRARWYFGAAAAAKTPADHRAAFDKAKESLDRALELDPQNETAAAMLSQLERMGR